MILTFEEVLNNTRQYIQKISGINGILNTGTAQKLLDAIDLSNEKENLRPISALNSLQCLYLLQEQLDNTSGVYDSSSPEAIQCNELRRDLADTLLDYIENIIGDTE